jgi:hypothetical protein
MTKATASFQGSAAAARCEPGRFAFRAISNGPTAKFFGRHFGKPIPKESAPGKLVMYHFQNFLL